MENDKERPKEYTQPKYLTPEELKKIGSRPPDDSFGWEYIDGKWRHRTENFSRVMGYFRPVSEWNHGKKQEFCDRKFYTAEEREGSDG